MATLSVRLSGDLEDRLEKAVRWIGTSRSEVVRQALSAYLRRCEQKRFMSELVEEARTLKDDAEALLLAEEWLPIENEASEVAEGGAAEDGARSGDPRWWR